MSPLEPRHQARSGFTMELLCPGEMHYTFSFLFALVPCTYESKVSNRMG